MKALRVTTAGKIGRQDMVDLLPTTEGVSH